MGRSFERSKSPTRWIVLILGCVMMIGSYYCLDIPAAVKTQLNHYMSAPNDYETKFQLLYTLYAAPNVVLPIFGGYIIDRFGVRISLFMFMSIITVGQIVVAIGFSMKSWTVVYLGRFIFGVGGESFTVANSAFLTNWFIGKELAFAFGVNMSFSRLASVFNNIISPYIIRETRSFVLSFWFGAVLCVICLLVVAVTLPIDAAMDDENKDDVIIADSSFDQCDSNVIVAATASGCSGGSRDVQYTPLNTESPFSSPTTTFIPKRYNNNSSSLTADVNSSEIAMINVTYSVVHRKEGNSPKHLDSELITPTTLPTSLSARDKDSDEDSVASNGSGSGGIDKNRTMSTLLASYREFKSLPTIFWVLVVSCVMVYGAVFPFNNISSSLLLERNYFQLQPEHSSGSTCALLHKGCQSDVNTPNQYCDTSKWYQPPLPYDVTVDGTYYAQVEGDDVDCTSTVWEDGGCTTLYCSRLADAESKASVIMSIPYIISAALSPPLGFLVDQVGLRAVIALLSPLLLIVVHLSLARTNISPEWPLIGQGLAYTGFISVLWPAVPLVIEEKVQGLAFGVVTAMQNLACAGIPLLVAVIFNHSEGKYIPNVEYLFVSLGVLGVLVGLYMNYYDYTHNSVLNRGLMSEENCDESPDITTDDRTVGFNTDSLDPWDSGLDEEQREHEDWLKTSRKSGGSVGGSIAYGSVLFHKGEKKNKQYFQSSDD